jgi:hypothetical protein
MDIIFINPNCLADLLIKSGYRVAIIEYSDKYVEDKDNIKIGTDIYNTNKLLDAIDKINRYLGVKCHRFLINYLDITKTNNYYKKIINILKLQYNISKVKGGKYFLTSNKNILVEKLDQTIYSLINSKIFNSYNCLIINEKSTLDMINYDYDSNVDIKDKKDIIDVLKYMLRYECINGKIELESRIKRIL